MIKREKFGISIGNFLQIAYLQNTFLHPFTKLQNCILILCNMHSYKLSSLTCTNIKQYNLVQYYAGVGPTH